MSAAEALVLQHIACEPPGVYEDVLLERGYAVRRVEIDEGEPLPGRMNFERILVMGGPMGAYDDESFPWLVGEKQFISRAVRAGIPYWGVCLGAQMLAAALDARVYPGPEPEVGLLPVTLAPTAADDPVFAGLPGVFPALQWHGDTFDLPEGAAPLARSAAYPNQAFRWGTAAYAVQFHSEVSAGMLGEWGRVPSYEASLERALGPGALPDLVAAVGSQEAEVLEIGRVMFERWLDATAPPGVTKV